MSLTEHLNKAKIKKDDEFYTSYDDVCTIFKGVEYNNQEYADVLYVLSCDSFENKSNFIKYCLDHNYKFVIMDDFHDMKNIITECHCIEVVTNPPFSKLREFIEAFLELKAKVSKYWSVNLTFICPQVVSGAIFKQYFKYFMVYDCLTGFFDKPDGSVSDVCINLLSTYKYDGGYWYKDPFALSGVKVFKQTKDAMLAVYTKQVWDYFYVTRAAICEQYFFKEHGWIIDYAAEYNRNLIRKAENPDQFIKFGMLKFVQDPDYDFDDYDDYDD